MRTVVGLALAVALVSGALAAVPEGEHRARIYVDDDRAGTASFTRAVTDEAKVDEVASRVAVKFLGFEVFEFTQNLRQRWKGGQLQSLYGYTDDDGEIFEANLSRRDGALVGTLNGEPVELPGEAFPTSVWHYEVTERPILFDVKDLELRHVKVKRSEEVLEIDGQRIPTERFDFVEGWDATVWYDDQQRLVQFVYAEGDHEVKVVPERCVQAARAGGSDLPAC
jgi:Family of unknown function (DUF6134)